VWSVYLIATKFRALPSEVVGLTDPFDAFRFNRAVHHFGSSLQAELDSASGKTEKDTEAKRLRILHKWIPEAAGSNARFRDPAKENR